MMGKHAKYALYYSTIIITPCACARGKVIGSVVVLVFVVVVSTKITKSRKIGVGQSSLCHRRVESHAKLSYVYFKSLRTALSRALLIIDHNNRLRNRDRKQLT